MIKMNLPTVLKLDGTVVIFGGGKVALRKVHVLSKFTKEIKIISDNFNKQNFPDFVETIHITITETNFMNYLPRKVSIIIVATSDSNLNHVIANWSKKNNILVNVVDDPKYCTILFPAISKKGDLSIAISTNGKCPFLSKKIREEIDYIIDFEKNWEFWLDLLSKVREFHSGDQKMTEILGKIYSNEVIKKEILNKNIDNALEIALK